MSLWAIAVTGIYIVVLQIVESGFIENGPGFLPKEHELAGFNFQNIKYDSHENGHQVPKTSNKNGFIGLTIENEKRGEIKSKAKITLALNKKSDCKSGDDCSTKDVSKTRHLKSQTEDTNQNVMLSQIAQKTVENIEIKTIRPSHRLTLQISQQATEKATPASDSILFINDFQNVFLPTKTSNQTEKNLKQKTNETMSFSGRNETIMKSREMSPTRTLPPPVNFTTENGERKIYDEDGRNEVILQSGSTTCLHSTKKVSENLQNVTMTCNNTKCVLKADSEKFTSWLCNSFICNVAKDVDLKKNDAKNKPVMDCLAEDRSLIAAPSKCLPDEMFANNKCRKIYKV